MSVWRPNMALISAVKYGVLINKVLRHIFFDFRAQLTVLTMSTWLGIISGMTDILTAVNGRDSHCTGTETGLGDERQGTVPI